MRFTIVLIVAMSAMASQCASASSLFYDKCDQQSSLLPEDDLPIVLVATEIGFAGMSCQDIKSAFKAAQILGIVLMPVSLALRTPGVREEIARDLATYGLTLANPAVLGVTVIGSVGLVTVYFVMKNSLEECERHDREELKQELLRDLKHGFPSSSGSNVPIEVRKDGHAA